jgi:hypothetical protein
MQLNGALCVCVTRSRPVFHEKTVHLGAKKQAVVLRFVAAFITLRRVHWLDKPAPTDAPRKPVDEDSDT